MNVIRLNPFKIFRAFVLLCLAAGYCNAQTFPVFNVKTYGAVGNGTNLDSPAINAAIAAAGAAGGGMVTFPAGNYFCGSIHLTNNLTLYLSNNAVIIASKTNIDLAESSPYSSFQDYGHTYFHDSLIWGENLTNIAFAGPGEINGNGNLTTGTPAATQGDKALALILCTNVTISGITITHGGHFGILADGCYTLLVSGAQILESNSRDGFNLIDSSVVVVTNCNIQGSDDAMVIKSDYALGRRIGGQNIHIVNCQILSTENNALQFGSETVGDFHDVTWANIGVGGAGKAGIGITSQDGSVIDGVTYDHITMTNCACPIFLKLDYRDSGSPNPSVGRIRNISINHVTATHSTLFSHTNTSTIDGFSSTTNISIENITFNDVNLSIPGGRPATDITNDPVQDTGDWIPNDMGLRPAYGWYLRHANNISFTNCQVHFDTNDDRPAIITDTVTNVLFAGFTADVGTNNTHYDFGFLNTPSFEATGVIASGKAPAPGNSLRIYASNSVPALIVPPPYFDPGDGMYSTAQTVTIADAMPGATIRYTTDGTTPSPTNGTLYSAPVAIGSETVLNAIAYVSGMTNSAVNTAIYNFPGTFLSLPPAPVVFAFEAESLPYITNGAVAGLQDDSETSGGHWLALETTGSGQWIQFTLTNIPAGIYDLQMSYKAHPDRGILSFTLDGVTWPDSLDQYANPPDYPTQDWGIVTFTNTGNHTILLTCLGKNPSATGYWLSVDQFILTAVNPPAIDSISLAGTQITIAGGGGVAGTNCRLLASTNISLPPNQWSVIATNSFDGNGDFHFTNTLNPRLSQTFYRLSWP